MASLSPPFYNILALYLGGTGYKKLEIITKLTLPWSHWYLLTLCSKYVMNKENLPNAHGGNYRPSPCSRASDRWPRDRSSIPVQVTFLNFYQKTKIFILLLINKHSLLFIFACATLINAKVAVASAGGLLVRSNVFITARFRFSRLYTCFTDILCQMCKREHAG